MGDVRDRTAEFLSALEALQSRNGIGTKANGMSHAVPMSSPGTLRRKGSQTKFAKAAGAIMHGIQSVSVKLERMTKHPSRNIQELRFVVKEEITRLSDDIQALQNFQKQGDTFGGRHSRDHSTAIVKDLQIKLADTTKNFQGILALRTKNLQAQASRRKRYGDARHLSLRKREVNSFGKLGPEGKTHSQLMIQEQWRYNRVRGDSYNNHIGRAGSGGEEDRENVLRG
eukprot:1263514-Amorphochlora_amoeboformis.AAC.1